MLKKDFLWGGATAANQFEGGYQEGGEDWPLLIQKQMAL